MNLEEGYQEESKLEEGKLDATANPYAMALKKRSKTNSWSANIYW